MNEMTVDQLKAALSDQPGDLKVKIVYDSGCGGSPVLSVALGEETDPHTGKITPVLELNGR